MRKVSWLVGLLMAATLGACSDADKAPASDPDRIVLAPPTDTATHSHTNIIASGDGTRPSAAGYTLTDVRVPSEADTPGEVSFRIVDYRGKPVTNYTEEQTKLLHLYVVRNDLQDFRHLHPVLGTDGVWRANVNLAQPGSYRVITEFSPADDPNGAHVVLGRNEVVPGSWQAAPIAATATGDDGVLKVTAPQSLARQGVLTLTLTNAAGEPAPIGDELGTFLGASAHLTGFNSETGAFTHAHPLTEPVDGAKGTTLDFHTDITKPGRYVFFVQVRVGGFVRTVPFATVVP